MFNHNRSSPGYSLSFFTVSNTEPNKSSAIGNHLGQKQLWGSAQFFVGLGLPAPWLSVALACSFHSLHSSNFSSSLYHLKLTPWSSPEGFLLPCEFYLLWNERRGSSWSVTNFFIWFLLQRTNLTCDQRLKTSFQNCMTNLGQPQTPILNFFLYFL